jgi:hypothetical protein
VQTGPRGKSKATFQGDFDFQEAQGVLLLALAGALFGFLLHLLAAMYLGDMGGSLELQVLSASDTSSQTFGIQD